MKVVARPMAPLLYWCVIPLLFRELIADVDHLFLIYYYIFNLKQVICPDDKISEAFANLTTASNALGGTFTPYTDDSLLDRWHIRNLDRFGPIVGELQLSNAFFVHQLIVL